MSSESTLLLRPRDPPNADCAPPPSYTEACFAHRQTAAAQRVPIHSAAAHVLRFSAPVGAAVMIGASFKPIVLAFVAWHDAANVAGAAIALNLNNSRSLTTTVGLASGLDTLLPQIFGRDPTDPAFGVMAQRMMAIMCAAFVPNAIFFFFANYMWAAMGFPPSVVADGAVFIRWTILGLLPLALFEIMRRYLQYRGAGAPHLAVNAATWPTLPLYLYLCMGPLGLGLAGAPIAWAAFMATCCVTDGVYIVKFWPDFPNSWGGLSRDAFREWGPVLRMAVPSLLLSALVAGPVQAVHFMSAAFMVKELTAFAIVASVAELMRPFTHGVAMAVAFHVGRSIGSGNGAMARRYAVAGALVTLPVALCVALLFVLLRYRIIGLFTADAEVAEIAAACALVAAVYFVLDAQQVTAGYICRGCGRQYLGVAIVSVSWVTGVPLCYLFAFHFGWGAAGLYAGLAASTAIVLPIFAVVLRRFPWTSMDVVEAASVAASPTGGDADHDMATR
jgi:MATE family multidrug resistance protein